MKVSLFVCSIVVALFSACGGGGSSSTDAAIGGSADALQPAVDALQPGIDANGSDPDAGAGACNPLAAAGEQGCSTGQKCAWVTIQDTPEEIGAIQCVPDGPVGIGGACTQGAVGAATGYDNCSAGGTCISTVCKDLCGFDGSPNASCTPLEEACTRYSGLGANGDDDPVIGACNPTCDPLTQTRVVGGVTQSCGVGQGCYLLASTTDTIAVCAGAGAPIHNEAIFGTIYANSCAPGHVPRVAEQGAVGSECAGLCKPANVYIGSNESKEGGDPSATNWQGMPATCESAGGATVRPEVPVTGESCTFYWTREPASGITNFSNTLGWCFNHASWKYDPDGMEPINNTDAYPRCSTLTTGNVVPPLDKMPANDALYFGCIELPAMTMSQVLPMLVVKAFAPKLDRLDSYRR